MRVVPFRGLRPRPDLAARIPSYPYDVLDSDEARRLAEGDPYSFLHVVKPEIDLDPSVGPYDDRVYEKGRENFRSMIDRGWLVRDARPAFYVYRLTLASRSQTGLVGAAALADYLEGRIRKHENTRPEKEQDRVRLNEALGANPGPVFLTYNGLPEINAWIHGQVARDPDVRFAAPDGVQHELWVIDEPQLVAQIGGLFEQVRRAYVADGHHRAAAAARVAAKRGGASHFLAAFFPADQLQILDYNRVVRDLNGLTPADFLERVRQAGFHVKAGHRGKRPPRRESFGMYLRGDWYLLSAAAEIVPREDRLRALDVSILAERLLQPILGIGDVRTDRRIDFVGGGRGPEELERRVDSGAGEVAFALYPTSLDDVMRIADAGEIMPPKSTWFEPKLRSGMVVQLLD